MYRVVNETSKDINFDESKVVPNQEIIVINASFDTKDFRSGELGVCEITSQYGEHSCHCSGNITCEPENGKDGTIFKLK